MPLTRGKKEEIVKELRDGLENAQAIVFINFHGLSVFETGTLRKTLKTGATKYKVAKKTLLTKVLAEHNYEGEVPALTGEVAVLYTAADPVFPAKKVFEFIKGKEEKISMLGGVLEGRYLAKDEIVALAKIPSREVLYGQVVNVLFSPVQGFHGVLHNSLSGFVRVLDGVAKSRS